MKRDFEAELIVRGQRVVLECGVRPASLHIRDGVIVRIGEWGEIGPSQQLFDAGECAILPGIVDLHAHINEPGRSEWEGFSAATRSAAAGGITTLVDMPLNSIPPTVNSDALREKMDAAKDKMWTDIGFHGGLVPGNAGDLPDLLRAGVVGLKCFLCDSGVGEFPRVSLDQLSAAFERVAHLDPWLLVHAESAEVLDAARGAVENLDSWTYHDYLRSRPDEAEYAAIESLIRIAEESRARVHIVHLSSAAALPLITAAKARHLRISAETCPHYLTFAAEAIAAGAADFKCAPPIRSAANREGLWNGLRDGVIDFIASDHSPCLPELKLNRDFSQAWGGIASLQCSLAAVWTEARRRGFALTDVARWMCRRPSELGRLPAKGTIAAGKDADLICFAPDESFTLEPERLFHRHKLTPYRGRAMFGIVEQTFVRGRLIYDRGSWANEPQGRIVRASPRPS